LFELAASDESGQPAHTLRSKGTSLE